MLSPGFVSRYILCYFRSEKRKLEEEYEEVKNEVMELTSENEEATIQKLQDEIKDCKAILKCGVCFDRPKEVTNCSLNCTAEISTI
jgi:E3 ubiquitin-protein ligase BRE1